MDAHKKISEQRTIDYKNGTYATAGGVPTEITADMSQFVQDYNSFYQTKRGYHPRSFGLTIGSSHVDLYDNMKVIPFDKIEKFFKDNLK